jgi:hypothetical protein
LATAAHRIYVNEFKSFGGAFGNDVVLTILETPEYARLVETGHRFRLAKLLTYWVGGVWAEVLYEFENISDDDMMLLTLRDNLKFNPDLNEIKVNDVPMGSHKVSVNDPTYTWDQRLDTRCEWEN